MENASTLHGLVFDQAERTPDALAIDDGSKTTYRELREQAEQVAASLCAHGVGRGDFVGICMGRSAELLAVVLGVLASGAAYVPLDPAYPKERLRFMTTDCSARVVICDKSFANFYDSELFESGLLTEALLDEAKLTLLSPEDLLQPQTQPAKPNSVDPEDLAYLLYTSGSTGQPKGVMIRHCNAVNLARWAREAFSDEDRSRILFSTSLSWDLSIFEIFASLAWGGTLVVVHNALTLAEVGPELGVTLVNTSPSVMSRLIHHRPLPDSVRVVTLAGEILHRELVEQLYQRSQSLRVWNLYGPTETTTFSTGGLIDRSETSSPPIGQPIRNTRLHLLDELMQPVEAGQVGEIWIGGDGVAAGYLHRPELTAEVFVPDPFAEEPKGNLYRTGDQARSHADGSVVVLGRLDHQVKLRGLRVELGEIDAQFLQLSAVNEAVTVVSQIGTSEPKLVAYLVAGQGCEIDEEQIRAALAQNLPPYMVPALIEVLDQLPLSPNGKIDRAALPAPGTGSASEESHAIDSAALSATEQEIAHIFGELLGVTAPLSTQADFFDCGGDSLGALQLVDLIAERLQVEIPLSTMFEESQVGQIAAFIDESEAGEAGPESRPAGMYALRSAGSKLPLFLGPLGNGGLRGYRKLIAQLDPDRPVYGMQAPGVDGETDPYRTVEEMGRHFAAEIAAFQPVGPILLGGFSYGGISAIEAAQQLQRAGREIALVVLLDTSPFSRRVPWTVAPRLRFRQGRDAALDTLAEVGLRELIRRRGYRFVVRTRRLLQRGLPAPKRAGSAQRTEHIKTVHQAAVNSYRSSEISFSVAVIAAATAAAKDRASSGEDPRSLAQWQFRLIDCPGVAHRDFLSEPTVSKVAAELDSVIESAVLESAVTRSAVTRSAVR
ncbi:amino acid adenylation enzyme/thioester reductase family protein [Actinobacteria bacterium IMCC26207]|nr:amino acid adenylation enzyme/thioester reductase family protein [Actinobacteria bacterium IMCC26207]